MNDYDLSFGNDYGDDENSVNYMDLLGRRKPQDLYGSGKIPEIPGQTFAVTPSENGTAGKMDDYTQSPAYQTYKSLLSQAPPSEQIMKDRSANEPHYADFQPSVIQKILAAVQGLGAGVKGGVGAGIKTGQDALMEPFMRQRKLWEMENDDTLQEARLADAGFNRKLQSAQFGLSEERQHENLNRQRMANEETVRKDKATEARQRGQDSETKRLHDSTIARNNSAIKTDSARQHKLGMSKPEKPVLAKDIAGEVTAESKIHDTLQSQIISEMAADPISAKFFKTDPNDGSISLSDAVHADPKMYALLRSQIEQRIMNKTPRYKRLTVSTPINDNDNYSIDEQDSEEE